MQLTVTARHTSGEVHNFGGYVGYYKSYSMSSTLIFDNVKANTTRSGDKFTYGYGGGIGRINSNSYVLFDGFELTGATGCSSADGGVFGGLVGRAENAFVAGTVNVKAYSDMYVGAAAAKATGNLVATDVNVTTEFTHSGSSAIVLGRLVGEADSNIGTISITNPTTATYGKFSGDIKDAVVNSAHSGNTGADSCFGGVIGKISQSKTDADYSWTISGVKLSGTIENTSGKTAQKLGGVIACINSTNVDKETNAYRKTLTLSNVTAIGLTIEGNVSSENSELMSSGGIFGYAWYDTDVVVNGVTVGSSDTTSTVKVTGAADFGGMIYNATGKWRIPANGLTLTNITIDATQATSFGMIINKGWYHPNSTDATPTGNVKTALQQQFPALYENGGAPTFGDIYLSKLSSKLTTFQAATEGKTAVPSDYDFPVAGSTSVRLKTGYIR